MVPGGVFGHAEAEGFETVTYCHDRASGLRAIVAVHSTALGPALGGTRFHRYDSEDDALRDVCRLARAMTYKHAVSGLDHGGGKAVILGDPATTRTDQLIRAYGRFVDGLGGRYLTAEDVGTSQADMDLIRQETPYVTGVSESLGGSGDPSPATAYGVYRAMATVVRRRFGEPSLAGRHFVVAGVGKVGSALAQHLAEAGAGLTVSDVDADAVDRVARRFEAAVVDPAAAHTVECDVLAPCALGGVLSASTIPQLRCAAVCGAANNQLATAADGVRLAERDVLFAPDYVVNAGGVINIAEEPHGYDRGRALDRIAGIATTLDRVFDLAEREGSTPEQAADRLAERRLAAAQRGGSDSA